MAVSLKKLKLLLQYAKFSLQRIKNKNVVPYLLTFSCLFNYLLGQLMDENALAHQIKHEPKIPDAENSVPRR
jgi:hypothetical protein